MGAPDRFTHLEVSLGCDRRQSRGRGETFLSFSPNHLYGTPAIRQFHWGDGFEYGAFASSDIALMP